MSFNNVDQNPNDIIGKRSLVKVKHLKDLKATIEKRKFLDSFDRIFCDCDGVIWQTLREAIPGSAQAIEFLRQEGKEVVFVTNNSISSVEEHLKKFQRCGIQVDKEDLIHPAQSICDYLLSLKFDGLIYCMATPPFREILKTAGFKLVEERPFYLQSLRDLHDVVFSKDAVEAIVVDVDLNLNAAKMMRAHVHLKNPDCLFIGGAADTIIPFCDGDIIGPGPFIAAIEQSTQRRACILGKPGQGLCEQLRRRYGFGMLNAKRNLFIGDSLTTDVRFGKMCGFQTMVVLTGATSMQDVYIAQENAQECPDYVADSLKDLMF